MSLVHNNNKTWGKPQDATQSQKAYHRNVKVVQVFPALSLRLDYIHLFEIKRPHIPDI